MLIPAAITILGWIAFLLLKSPSPHEHAARLRHFVAHNLSVCEEVHIKAGNRGLLLPDLVKATQAQLDFRLTADAVPLRYVLVDNLPERIPAAMETQPIPGSLAHATEVSLSAVQEQVETQPLYEDSLMASSSFTLLPNRTLDLYFHDKPHLWVDLYEPLAILAYNLEQVHRNDVPFFATQVLYDALLEPDLTMWKQCGPHTQRKFGDYRPQVRVNFVAAEETSETPSHIIESIEKYMKRFSILEPFVKVNTSIQVLDVSKRRASPHLTKNTSLELTFFYLTSLRPYTNNVQGVSLYHISPEIPKDLGLKDRYGTEYQAYQKRLQTTVYNMSDFFLSATREISKFVGLPDSYSANLALKTMSALKHYTILGVRECLDVLLDPSNYEEAAYVEVSKVVDSMMSEVHHDWEKNLKRVYEVHRRLLGK